MALVRNPYGGLHFGQKDVAAAGWNRVEDWLRKAEDYSRAA
jgi:hypothetical protein